MEYPPPMEYLVRSIQYAKGAFWPAEAQFKNLLYLAPMGVFLLLTPFLVGELPSLARPRVVNLNIEGKTASYPTTAKDVKGALLDYGIVASEHDQVVPGLDQSISGLGNISYRKAFTAFVEDEGNLHKVTSADTGAEGMIAAAGLDVLPEDRISLGIVHYDFVKHGGIGKKVSIERAPRITLKADGKEVLMASWAGTVGELLAEKEMSLQNLDYSIPGPEAPVTHNMSLFIKRVLEEDRIERIVTESKTVLNFDPGLGFFDKRIDQAEQQGITDKTFHIRLEDGELVSRQHLTTTPVQQLKNLLISRGARFSKNHATRGASWYGGIQSSKCGFNGATAAVGYGLRDVKKCSKLRVMNVRTGRSVDVMVTDTCTCWNVSGTTTMIDLSRNAFFAIHNSRIDGNIGGVIPEIRVQLLN